LLYWSGNIFLLSFVSILNYTWNALFVFYYNLQQKI